MAGEINERSGREGTSRLLRNYQAVGFTGATAADLATALNTYFEEAGEKVVVGMFPVEGGGFLIIFTE